jgi:hypothetical protein
MDYQELREKYDNIIYKNYEILATKDTIQVKYTYILNKYIFTPSIYIDKKHITNKNINNSFLEYLFFNYGIANIINYYKLTCPKKITIECGYIDNEQINFFKKLLYNGLGEYFYRNKIDLSFEDFTNFEIKSTKAFNFKIEDEFNGNLIMVGGGKDSIVSLELLDSDHKNNKCFLFERNIYPKNMPSYNSIYTANYTDDDIVIFSAEIDSLLLDLNKKGFLNGHVPVSSLLAFSSYIMAYLTNKKYIVTSNEASSNESSVKGTNINHQYSKSIEFENDFRNYTKKYFTEKIEYYSLLRPLLEIQIAKLFSKHEKYHNIFRSCNLSSKNSNTNWCCNCPKCLFVYIILSPFIEQEKLEIIFGKNMLNDETFLNDFNGLLGKTENKPFECVGTYEEVRYACSSTIKKLQQEGKNLPYLLKFYLENYNIIDDNLMNYFNGNNNVPIQLIEKIKKEFI